MHPTIDPRISALLKHGDRLCASLFLPRSHTAPHGDRVRFTHLVHQAKAALSSRGMKGETADVLLAPAITLAGSPSPWRGDHAAGLALFCANDLDERIDLPFDVTPLAVVGFGCHVRPLLDLPASDERFLVLVLHKNRARLFDADRSGLRPSTVTFPERLVEPRQHVGRDHDAQSKTIGHGAGGGTVVYGTGVMEHLVHDQVSEYFREIDRVLHQAEPTGRTPLVLAGDDHVVPLMRAVSHYKHLLPQTVAVNTDELDAAALHRLAWPVVEPLMSRTLAAACERYATLAHGVPASAARTASDLVAILPAATQGRVDVLFIDRDAHAWGRFNEVSSAVERHDRVEPTDEELLNRAVIATLLHHGTVHQVGRADLPADGDAAAILRF